MPPHPSAKLTWPMGGCCDCPPRQHGSRPFAAASLKAAFLFMAAATGSARSISRFADTTKVIFVSFPAGALIIPAFELSSSL